jgi:predicted HicB family RNase H-like nuclease
MRLMPRVEARVIRVSSEIYERLEREAQRRGISPNAFASELLTTALTRLGNS